MFYYRVSLKPVLCLLFSLYIAIVWSNIALAQPSMFLRKKSEIIAEKGVDQLGVLSTDAKELWLVKTTNGKPSRIRAGYFGSYPSIPTQTTLSRNGQKLTLRQDENVVSANNGHLLTREDRLESSKYESILRIYNLDQVKPQIKASLVLPGIAYDIQPIVDKSSRFYVSDEFEGSGSEIVFYDSNLRVISTLRPLEGGFRRAELANVGNQLVLVVEPHQSYTTKQAIIIYFLDSLTLKPTDSIKLPLPYSRLSLVNPLNEILLLQTFSTDKTDNVFQAYLLYPDQHLQPIESNVVLNSPVQSIAPTGRLIVGIEENKLTAIDSRSGKIAWQNSIDNKTINGSKPTILFSITDVASNLCGVLAGTPISTGYQASFLLYSADGTFQQAIPIGNIQKGFKLYSTATQVILSQSDKVFIYEKASIR